MVLHGNLENSFKAVLAGVHEAVVVMAYGGHAEDVALTIHAHPTLSEAMKEAALAVDGRPLHI